MADVNEVQVSPEPTTPEAVAPAVPQPGEKTDSALLLKSLKEERAKIKELESELQALRNTPEKTDEVFSDEGRALKQEIDSIRETMALKEVKEQFPALKDKQAEFDEFRQDFPRHKLENVAKLFLAEKGLLEQPQPRKGLEPTTGGGRAPVQTGMSS